MKSKCSKNIRKLIAASVILSLLVTFVVPWIVEGRTGESSSYVSLAFEGIGKGLDPKGNHFDINEIKSDEVLNRAIKTAGLEGKYTPQQLRRMIVIKPLAGKNALSQLTKISMTSEKTKSVVENAVNTGEYKITVKEIGIIPNPFSNLKLSKAIMQEYKKYLKTSYLVDSTISSAYEKKDISTLDYPEMMLVMVQDADALVRYISGFVKNAPDFVSEETGLTFADIKSQAEVIRDKEIGSAANIVDYYVLTKNGSHRIDYENVKMKRARLILKKNEGITSRIGYILNSYDNSSNYIVASENAADLGNSQENVFYGDLMNQLVASKNATINAKYDVAEIQKHLDKLSQGDNSVDKATLAKSVESDAKEAYSRMEQLRKEVKALAEENYDLNIGSKISITNSSYGVNGWGNLLINFIISFVFVWLMHALYQFVKSKDKGYFKEVLKVCIKYWDNKISHINRV